MKYQGPSSNFLENEMLCTQRWSGPNQYAPSTCSKLGHKKSHASCILTAEEWIKLAILCWYLKNIFSLPMNYRPLTYAERRRGRVVRAALVWHRKSPYRASSRLCLAMRRLENSLCRPSSKWVPFSN